MTTNAPARTRSLAQTDPDVALAMRNELHRQFARAVVVAIAVAVLDLQISADGPAQLLQSL